MKISRGRPERRDTHFAPERKVSEDEVMKAIEDNLRKLAEDCAQNSGTVFQLERHGVKCCCLFMHGSNSTHLCPFVEEETIDISDEGGNTMRYKCRCDIRASQVCEQVLVDGTHSETE